MHKILVTGGAGFIGSNFVRHMLDHYKDCEIHVLDCLTYAGSIKNLPLTENSGKGGRLHFHYGNVRNGAIVSELVSRVDTVVHFAAETHVTRSIFDNSLFFETDVLGTQVVSGAVLAHRDRIERFIHVSSSEVYGSAVHPKMDEDHPLLPRSPYAAAKAGADRLVYSYWCTYNLPIAIVRPFNTYGPYQHLEKVIPRFITGCILGEPLRVHGSGEASRDWMHVEDGCRALEGLLHCPIENVAGKAINLGTGISTSIARLAEMIADAMGVPRSHIEFITDRPGQVERHTADNEKARLLIGWKPKVTLSQGLERAIAWYKENRSWWEDQLWMRMIPIESEPGKTVYH